MLELDAAGDLDATVDVYRRERSQLTSLDCGQTNRRGRLTLDFRQPRNGELLIRVAPRQNSARDAFTMRVVAPDAPERPPGRALALLGRVRKPGPHRQPRRRVRHLDVRRAAPIASTSSRAIAA